MSAGVRGTGNFGLELCIKYSKITTVLAKPWVLKSLFFNDLSNNNFWSRILWHSLKTMEKLHSQTSPNFVRV
jgi:hypothetical protein